MDTFQALAEPKRREILELLAKKGALTSTSISSNFEISPPAISQHLKILRETKLVDMEKKAQNHIYSVNKTTVNELGIWINGLTGVWDKKFKRLEKLLDKGGEK